MREMRRKMDKWDYTFEQCPFCGNEVVIYSKGITACPECGKPTVPCTVCEMYISGYCDFDCCPYGCTGDDENLPITNPPITPEEIDFAYASW